MFVYVEGLGQSTEATDHLYFTAKKSSPRVGNMTLDIVFGREKSCKENHLG